MKRRRRGGQAGFSLLEVLVALAIVSITVIILVQSNAIALKSMNVARRTTQATLLSQELMTLIIALTDRYGFGEADVHDEGNFDRSYPNEYPDWTWEYSLAKTEIVIPDLSGLMEDSGVDSQTMGQAASADALGALGGGEALEEMFGNYIREVRVKVCYPTGRISSDCIELVSHIANPGGQVMAGEEQQVVLQGAGIGSGELPGMIEKEGE